ncbi:MAG TPA: AMP-binding protein [Ktedonobacteraceae bacterium]|jgi:phenylacetate-coenzyme A ligase PaaK-like adenylate-forming protein
MREIPPATSTDLLMHLQDQLCDEQNRRFRHQIALCFRAHPYYQALFRRLKLTPEDFQTLEDVQKLPITTKQDYLSDPEAFRLTGLPEFLPQERTLWDVHYTTGTTTGIPAPFFNTTYDFFACLEAFKRLAGIVGITARDRVINLYPLPPFPHLSSRLPSGVMAVGASVVSPLMSGLELNRNLDEVVRIIEQQQGTVLGGIGSYVRRVILRAEELGADFSRVHLVLVAGEPCPGGTREEMRQRLVRLGASKQRLAIKSGLGFTEMQGSTGECVELGGSHHPAPEQIFFEVLDEQRHVPLPDGMPGLFVITHLDRRGTVLLRFAIGDLTAISHEICPHCGRQGPRLVANALRTFEQVTFNGALLHPDTLKEAIATVEGIEEYQIVFTRQQSADPSSPDALLVRVAAQPGEQERVQRAVGEAVRGATSLRPSIEFVDSLNDIFDPNQTFKSTRVVDLRG